MRIGIAALALLLAGPLYAGDAWERHCSQLMRELPIDDFSKISNVLPLLPQDAPDFGTSCRWLRETPKTDPESLVKTLHVEYLFVQDTGREPNGDYSEVLKVLRPSGDYEIISKVTIGFGKVGAGDRTSYWFVGANRQSCGSSVESDKDECSKMNIAVQRQLRPALALGQRIVLREKAKKKQAQALTELKNTAGQ